MVHGNDIALAFNNCFLILFRGVFVIINVSKTLCRVPLMTHMPVVRYPWSIPMVGEEIQFPPAVASVTTFQSY